MKDATFPKLMRLRKPEDIQAVFDKKTVSSKDQFFVLLAAPNGLAIPRVVILVSKKKVRLANQRVWIRRCVRESFRHHKNIVSGFDIVVIFRGKNDRTNLKEHPVQIKEQIDKLWIKLCANPHACMKKQA